jgi:hypothetical protein
VEFGGGGQSLENANGDLFATALAGLLRRIEGGCGSGHDWPAAVGLGLYAGLDYLTQHPRMADVLFVDPAESAFGEPFRQLVKQISGLLKETVPVEAKPTPDAPTAAIAGVTLLVGDCLRGGRPDRLLLLRSELHLLILLPFLGFDEAKTWVAAVEDETRS